MPTPRRRRSGKRSSATTGSLGQRKRINDLLLKLNNLRRAHGADTYTIGQVKKFAASQYGGGAKARESFLTDWFALYSELAPRFAEMGIDLQRADNYFIERRGLGIGPAAYRRYAESLMRDPYAYEGVMPPKLEGMDPEDAVEVALDYERGNTEQMLSRMDRTPHIGDMPPVTKETARGAVVIDSENGHNPNLC